MQTFNSKVDVSAISDTIAALQNILAHSQVIHCQFCSGRIESFIDNDRCQTLKPPTPSRISHTRFSPAIWRCTPKFFRRYSSTACPKTSTCCSHPSVDQEMLDVAVRYPVCGTDRLYAKIGSGQPSAVIGGLFSGNRSSQRSFLGYYVYAQTSLNDRCCICHGGRDLAPCAVHSAHQHLCIFTSRLLSITMPNIIQVLDRDHHSLVLGTHRQLEAEAAPQFLSSSASSFMPRATNASKIGLN